MSNLGVSHDSSKFTENQTILTLEDKSILEDGEDVLHCPLLREREVAERNLRRKAKLPDQEDIFGDRILPGAASLLSHREQDEVDLTQPKFHLNSASSPSTEMLLTENPKRSDVIRNLKSVRVLSSDYLTRKEIDTKAPKLKRRRSQRSEGKATAIEEPLRIVSRGKRRVAGEKTKRKMASSSGEKAGKPRINTLQRERELEAERFKQTKEAEKSMAQKVGVDFSEDECGVDIQIATCNNAQNISQRVLLAASKAAAQQTLSLPQTYNETAAFLEGVDIVKSPKLPARAEEAALPQKKPPEKFLPSEAPKHLPAKDLGAEPLASESVSDALKLFRQRGLLRSKEPQNFAGRANDEKPSFFADHSDPAPEVRLEHLDAATGRPLSRKEAFRQLSHVFHGRSPGDSKKATLRRHMGHRAERRAQHSAETPMGIAAKARASAKAAGRAFVPLDGNRNAALLGLTKGGPP